jgi:hypothetical protein
MILGSAAKHDAVAAFLGSLVAIDGSKQVAIDESQQAAAAFKPL